MRILGTLGLGLLACSQVNADERPAREAIADAAAPVVAEPPPSVAPPPTAPAGAPPMLEHRFVLHVGDSTVGYTLGLQLELARMFKGAGVRYESRTVTAAGLHTFATEKILDKLVGEKDPDLVIVQVGTNNLTVPHPEAYIEDLRSIVRQAQGRDCYWIGPIPIDRPEKGMRAVLRDHTQPCAYFDSYELDVARQSDLVHPTQPGAKKWADAFWAFATKTAPGR